MSPSNLSDLNRRTLAVVMAGGNGTRLGDLTRHQAKPALHFGGQYRNVDFPLSNCINSGIRRISLLTQYKAHSLIQHVTQGWSFLRPQMGEFIELWPAQQRRGKTWYAGTADAVFQNIDLIEEYGADYVLVLAGDHIYKMDYAAMIRAHVEAGATATVGCIEVPIEEASEFGVMSVDAQGWIQRFDEKPARPAPTPRDAASALASMGIYVFGRELLAECLMADAKDPASAHDFGRDVLPALIERSGVLAYAFRDPKTGGQGYWRDVGTLDSYWQTHMDLLVEHPEFDLHDPHWPIWTHQAQCPPPKFIGDGVARASIVSGGCRVGGEVERSVLSTNCSVGAGSLVSDSVLLPDVTIGRDCRVFRAIIDAGCVIRDGTVIGENLLDEAEHFQRSAGGVTLVTARMLEAAARERGRRQVA
jgi:glucose-1-phosphate adenylyltransferase